MEVTVQELADNLGISEICGHEPNRFLSGVAPINQAGEKDVTFLFENKYASLVKEKVVGAIVLPPKLKDIRVPERTILLYCENLSKALIDCLRFFHPEKQFPPTIHETAVIDPTAQLGKGIHIGPYVFIGKETIIGDHTVLMNHVSVGESVQIGESCRIHPKVSLYDGVTLGNRVTIHSGSVIGADGHGYKTIEGKHVLVPQVGTVVIEDDVVIGANTCIDRATMGMTKIGVGTKIDNLVQVAHNNIIGKHVLISGLTGISGSSNIGDYAILAGGTGISDHVTVGEKAVVMISSTALKDVPPGEWVFGYPAVERRKAFEITSLTRKLKTLFQRVKSLEKKLQ